MVGKFQPLSMSNGLHKITTYYDIIYKYTVPKCFVNVKVLLLWFKFKICNQVLCNICTCAGVQAKIYCKVLKVYVQYYIG